MSFRDRILVEKTVMTKIFPGARFSWEGNAAQFELWYKTTGYGNQYLIRLRLSEHFPDKMPALYVVSPLTLRQHGNGKPINSFGVSHFFHTHGNGPGGCVQICHIQSQDWDASKTCVAVFIRGLLWLEAYDMHLKTGKSISDILTNLKRRQESWKLKEKDYKGLLRTWHGEETQPINLDSILGLNLSDLFRKAIPLGEDQAI